MASRRRARDFLWRALFEIDPQAKLQPTVPATFLLHKPAGLGTADAMASLGAAQHWQGDASGVRPLRSHHVRLVPLLELPAPASGLCVFSQDGRIVRKLREDAHLVEQELLAEVACDIAPHGLQRLWWRAAARCRRRASAGRARRGFASP